MSLMRKLLVPGAMVVLGACTQLPEPTTLPATVELAPAVQPAADVPGQEYTLLNKLTGAEEITEIVSVSAGTRVARNQTSGCSWGRSAANPFAPATMWKDCGGHTGGRQIVSTEGALWPLQVGASQTWTSEGTSDSGETWSDRRTCTVEGTANVTVPAGTFDTFHVKCLGENRVRDYYYAPDIQRTVISRSTHQKGGEAWYYEFVGLVPQTS